MREIGLAQAAGVGSTVVTRGTVNRRGPSLPLLPPSRRRGESFSLLVGSQISQGRHLLFLFNVTS